VSHPTALARLSGSSPGKIRRRKGWAGCLPVWIAGST
jgi:hypothetical protein